MNPLFIPSSLSRFRATRASLLALFCAGVLLQSASAQTYYWDNNNATAGFGTAGGTWAAPTTNNSTQGWSTSSAGTSALSGTTTTTTSDALNFGTGSAGLAAGTITLSGTVSANSLTFGSQSGAIVLSAGTLSLGGTTPTITVNNAADTISSAITGSAGLTKNGTGTLTLSGNNTYTGTTAINAGTLTVGNGSTSSSYTTASGAVLNLGSSPSVNFSLLGNGTVNITGAVSAGSTALTIGMGSGGLIDVKSGASISYGWGNDPWTSNLADLNVVGTIYGAGNNIVVNALTGNSTTFTMGGGTIVVGVNNGNGTYTGTLARNYADAHFRKEGSGTQTLNGTINLGATGTITQIGSGNLVINGAVQNGSVTQNGTGTLTLAGNNTYSGTTTISAGTLALGANQSLGAIEGAGVLNLSTYTLTTTASTNNTLSGVVVGSGNLIKAGTGTLTLSGNNTYTGTTTISAGTLQIGGAGLLGGGSYSANISNSGALVYSSTANQTLSGNITGAGSLTKNNTGTLTLLGTANTYNGATAVSGGTLQLAGNITSSALTLNSGGVISVGTNSTITTVGKANAASLTINAGSGYALTIGNVNASVAGTDYDQITASGALTLNNTAANPFTVYLNGTPTGWNNGSVYSWDIISAASLSGVFNSGNFTTNFDSFGIAAGNRTGTWSFTNPSGGNITLNYTAAGADSIWAGTTGVWSGNFTPGVSTDKNITFTGAGGTATNDIASGTLSSVNFITFNSTAGAYTLNATTGAAGLSGGTALTVKGDIINNSSNATGQTISMALALGSTSTGIINTAAGNITIGGVISGTGVVTKNGNSTLTLSAANTYTGGVIVNAGTLVLSAANVHTGATAINGGTLSLTGNLSGGTAITTAGSGAFTQGAASIISGTASLTQNSSGTTTLAGANTYNGSTALRAGTLHINNATAIGTGTLTIAGGTIDNTTGSAITLSTNNVQNWNGNFTFTGTKDLNLGTGAVTMNSSRTVTVNAGNLTVGGVISGAGYSLTKNGSGTLILSAVNTYSGGTTINAGTLRLQAAATNLYNTSNLTYNINNGSSLVFATGAASNPSLHGTVVNIDSTGGGTIAIDGLNAILNGAPFTINSNGGAQNKFTSLNWGDINDQISNTAMVFNVATGTNATADFLVDGGMRRRNAITKNGTGKLLFQNTTVGGINAGEAIWDIRINQGTMEFAGTSTLTQSASYVFANNGTFSWNSTANSTISSNITGTGNLTKSNTSTLTLNGTNSYTGLTTITAGTLAIGNNMIIGAIAGTGGNLSLGAGFTLTTNSTTDSTFSGVISSSGALMKNGTSTLTLSGNNTYSGTTTINAGTLTVSGGSAIVDTGAVTIASGAAFNIGASETVGSIAGAGNIALGSYTLTSGGDNSSTTLSGVISGTGNLIKSGTGNLTLTGISTFNGNTTISGGKLVLNGSATNSAVTIGNGATLAGSGSVGAVTVQSGGLIAPGNSPGNIYVSTLTLEGGGGYNWEITNVTGTAGVVWDFITVGGGTGAATINATSGNKFTVYISGNPTGWDTNTAYDWNIIDWGAVSGFDATAFEVDTTGFTGTAPIGTWSFSNSGGYLNLAYIVGDPTWNGGTGNWTTGFTPNLTGANMSIYFAGNNTATATNNIASATVGSVASITFNSTAGAYTLAANSGSAGYDNASALVLNGNILNNSTATQTINLALTSNATRTYDAAAGNITISGAISGTGGLTKNGSNTLALSEVNTYTGATTINAGTLTISAAGQLGSGSYSGNIANSGTFNYASSANQTLGGIISGTGALTKDGASNLTLTGVNTYTGATTITAGTLTISGAGQLGSGNYSGNIINNGVLAYNSSANQTLGGTISGTGDLVKNGNSTLTLSHANTYNGSTTINAGTLSVSASNALGATTDVIISEGGSMLVAALDGINDAASITMGNNGTLILNGTGEVVGAFSMSHNATAVIDMGYADSWISFWKFESALTDATRLEIWNYTVGSDHVYIREDTNGYVAASLPNVTFYSDFGTTSLGNGFFSAPELHSHIVPEPETYATAALLLIGLGIYAYRRRQAKASQVS